MNVFVLCAGRTASATFASAAAHLSGFTAGHETLAEELFDARFAYPENHIEVDNRLAFFLGGLEKRYGNDAYYVHLRRDPDKVAASYRNRWYYQGSIVRAFYSNILMNVSYDSQKMLDACRFYVQTNDENIRHFLKDKQHSFDFELENANEDFPRFADWLGAECPAEGLEVWASRSNLNRESILKQRLGGFGARLIRTVRALPTVYRDM